MNTKRRTGAVLVVGVMLCGLSVSNGCKKEEPAPSKEPPPATQSPPVKKAPPPVPTGPVGTIAGTVQFKGTAPTMPKVQNGADPACAQHEVYAETVLVSETGGLQDVVVRIAPGQVKGHVPAEPIVVDQTKCMYRPRVQAGVVGQMLEVRNSDVTTHNIHAKERALTGRQGTDTLFNRGQPKGSPPMQGKLLPDIDVYEIKCDQHAWMRGYIVLSDNPYHAVSNETGSFVIKNVPVGKHKVQTWHAFYGLKDYEVTVEEGKTATLDAAYDGEKDKPRGT